MSSHLQNEINEYYRNQAGSGLAGFQGYQYQRGHGFFSTIFQSILKPLGLYLGKQALATGIGVGSDILQGQNFKESLKKNAKITSNNMLNDGIARAQKFAQTGSGKTKRRRRAPKNQKKLKLNR